ncbi:MAG: hypothetical protein ACOC5D_07585 [Thermoplasmatota archaeon]
MNKNELIKSAKKLEIPSEKSVSEFSEKKDELAVKQKEMMKENDNLEEVIGEGNLSVMDDNLENMVDFFHSIFEKYEPQVFVNTVEWVFRSYRSHGFKPEFWRVNLETFMKNMDKELNERTFDELVPFVNWIMDHESDFVDLTDEYQKEV